MSPAYRPLIPAVPEHDDSGRPVSRAYGDVYHPLAGAPAQARQVFLQGNGLPGRWRARASFTVCETGFGLGLSFLALWQAWREDPQRPRRLHVVSVEAHPFSREDLRAMLARHAPACQRGLADALLAQWPPLLPGLHRLEFEGGALTLTLGFGWAEELVPRLAARVDAYFLDGFAPAGNPAMWSAALLRQLGELAAPDATLATWCSAGAVRRALADAGFAVTRREGVGGKRHITVGVRTAGAGPAASDAAPAGAPRHALVVGGGPAGAGVAQALALRGWRVTVLDACGARGLHAGHLAAACTPLLARDDNARARLSRAGSRRALARWQGLPEQAAPSVCGTVQVARDAQREAGLSALLQTLAFPAGWVRQVCAAQASELAGMPVRRGGLFLAEGMLVRPAPLLAALLETPGVQCLAGSVAALAAGHGLWHARDEQGRTLASAPVAVIANAAGAPALLASAAGGLQAWPALARAHALAGEVTQLPAAALGGGPRCIVGGEGYLLPAQQGWCVAGSTYVHGAAASAVTPAGQASNLGKAAGLLDFDPPDPPPQGWPGWAGWRAVLPGRLPAIGAVPGQAGLWLACGYASRGFSWSALAGDVIGAALEGEPMPLERDLLKAVGPR
ncbi:tRNA (5-methylaminomethyl-2-thiouridine)(34)-methyltransferase MnmD [Orrella sp. JC864]|uniref:tRNA (5-methylaminomethyl-2-thiouridine)(34)-methyltransferase MnmD n=1 Tax=Orrella sp. JC864 TaxID=3120298 RepID=UPI003009E305